MGNLDIQFKDMNAGAHRKPATKIAAPALTWHRIFWKPSFSTDGAPEDVKNESEWWENIDHLLHRLYCHISTSPGKQDFECPNLQKNTLYLFKNKVLVGSNLGNHSVKKLETRSVRHEIFSIRSKFNGVIVVVSARLHHEYFELMICIELPIDRKFGDITPSFEAINIDFKKLQDFIITNYLNISESMTIKPNEPMAFSREKEFASIKNDSSIAI